MSKPMEIMIYDSSLNYVGIVDDYEYFRWTRKFRGIDDFELQINRYKNGVSLLQINNYIVFKNGEEYRAGRIEFKEISLNGGKVSEKWTIKGRSMAGLLEDRICMHGISDGDGYTTVTDEVTMVMATFVTNELIVPDDPNRDVAILRVELDITETPTVTGVGRLQPLSELLYELSLVSGVGYNVFFSLEEEKFVFKAIIGVDKTYSNGVNPPVLFSPDFDNIKSLTFRESILGLKNVAIVGGKGEAQERTFVEVGTSTGENRREVFIDARDLDTGLEQRGQERLNELQSETILEFEHTQNGPFKYLIDFDLGDIVTVIYPEIAQLDARIVQINEEYEANFGYKFTLTVGSEFNDLGKVLKLSRKNTEPEIRR